MPYWLLAYDLACNKHRRHCRETLRGLAKGYQRSVFEVQASQVEIRSTMEILSGSAQGRDSLLAARILPLHHAWSLGSGVHTPPSDLLVIS